MTPPSHAHTLSRSRMQGLPNMFAESGWLIPTLIFLLVWGMSSVSTGMYAEAMRRVPGNENFKARIEYLIGATGHI